MLLTWFHGTQFIYASMRRDCAIVCYDACSDDLIAFTVIISGSKLDSAPENKTKLMQCAGNVVKTFERELVTRGQDHKSDFPAGAKKTGVWRSKC